MGDYFDLEDDLPISPELEQCINTYLEHCDPKTLNSSFDVNITTYSPISPLSNSSELLPPLSPNDDIFTLVELPDSTIYDESSSPLQQTIDHQYQPSALLSPLSNHSSQQNDNKLSMIIQPRSSDRGRYRCETNREINASGLPWRLIQGDSGNDQSPSYPTIRIPSCFQNFPQIYIRVTLVTVTSDDAPDHYIHPYPIDTPDSNALQDPSMNSIYFPIYENDFRNEEKSFRIRKIKLTCANLEKYGPLRLFDRTSNASEKLQSTETTLKPRQLIKKYRLAESLFDFTLAQRNNTHGFDVFSETSIKSEVMLEKKQKSKQANEKPEQHASSPTIYSCQCIPNHGMWEGGETVVIILSKPVDTVPTIVFDFASFSLISATNITLSGPTTILCKTPSCPYPVETQRIKAKIHIQHEEILHSPIDFEYIALLGKVVLKRPLDNKGESAKKRISEVYLKSAETDSADSLVNGISQLTIQQQPTRPASKDDDINLKKYLAQLKQALNTFIRTDNSSQLFRRTRVLIISELTNSLLLHDAIANGRTKTVMSLFEQILDLPASNDLFEEINERGETPLLIAAKFNQGQLVECILKKRPEYIKQKDKNGNNLFHLLANLKDDQGVELIEKILLILSDDISIKLFKEKNRQNQTPMDIAKASNNTSVLSLLSF